MWGGRTHRLKSPSTSKRELKRIRKLLNRVREASLQSPYLYGPLAALLATALVLLLTPFDPLGESIPEVGQIARRDYRAPHDFSVEVSDPAAEARAREAVARTPRVYRLDPDVSEKQITTLRETFAELRDRCRERERLREQLRREQREELDELMVQLDEARDANTRREIEDEIAAARVRHAEKRDEALQHAQDAFATARSEALARLGPDTRPSSLEALALSCFPETIEKQMVFLLEGVFESDIIGDKAELSTEIERGIDIIRPPHDETVHQGNLQLIIDRSEARRRVTGAAHRLFASRQSAVDRGDVVLEEAILDVLTGLVAPNLRFDHEATREARAKARAGIKTTRQETIRAEQSIIEKGQVVTSEIRNTLEEMQRSRKTPATWRSIAGITMLVVLLLALFHVVGVYQVRMLRRRWRDLVFMGTVLLAMVALLRLNVAVTGGLLRVWDLVPLGAYYFAMPFAAGAMFVRIFVGARAAVVFAVILALFSGVLVHGSTATDFHFGRLTYYTVVLALVSGLLAAVRSSAIRQRSDIIHAGLVVAGFNVLLVLSFVLLEPVVFGTDFVAYLAGGALSGLGSALVVGALAPVFEWAFDYPSSIKLLELGSHNHPLLKRLILEAPGTYHHSFLVSSMVESAAEPIRADPLLARVAALYHDVGKLKNPSYFGENQRGANRHDRLQPTMSALILRTHLRDSVKEVTKMGLGKDICDIVEQHHGTTRIEYFYKKACEAGGDGPPPLESDFRYPGPKPQSREAALVMLADSVEAAVRSMPEKGPERIRGMVSRVVVDKFTDGQLDACDLTLRNLNHIEKVFTHILQGVYHARPTYPVSGRSATPDTPSGRTTRRSQQASPRSRGGDPRTTTGQTKHHLKPESAAARSSLAPSDANAVPKRPNEPAPNPDTPSRRDNPPGKAPRDQDS